MTLMDSLEFIALCGLEFGIYTWKKVKEHFKPYFKVLKIPITRSLTILNF